MSPSACAAAVTAAELTRSETEQVALRYRLSSGVRPVAPIQIRAQFRLLVDLVMGEAGLYAPDLAALALKQTEGDTDEAVVVLRATRQTLERRHVSQLLDTRGCGWSAGFHRPSGRYRAGKFSVPPSTIPNVC